MADDQQPTDRQERVASDPCAQARAGWNYIKSRYGPGSSVDFRAHYHCYASGDLVLLDAQLADRDRAALLNAWVDAESADSADCYD